jgi:hypothetical protein
MAMIKVDFEFDTKYGKFSDAIWYSEESPMSDEEIETEKQRRLNNWLNLIENPPESDPEV